MELSGVGPDGKPVKASVFDFAEKLRQGGEELSFNGAPTTVSYVNRRTGERRDVDLQEVAQAAGIKNVQFKFDPASAKAKGLLVDRDIDQGVAYNLERIKTDDLKQKYLADKGFANVYRSGDDFYSFENGKMYPVNNKTGGEHWYEDIDTSDFTRMLANAGRDLGAAGATTAAVGASGVTGGATLVAAGAAGGAGGVAGEGVHRMVDKALGVEADRYNRQLSDEEEAGAYAKAGLMGAAQGVAQPIINSATANVAEKAVAPAVRTAFGEWGAKQAAKLEAGAAMARLPQGYMAKFATAEEASAMTALQEGTAMLRRGALSAEGMQAVTAEAKDMLKPGGAKIAPDAAEEHFIQQGMRERFQSATLEQAKRAEVESEMAKAAAKERGAAVAEAVERQKEVAQEAFAPHKKELETLFNPNADAQESIAAQRKIVSKSAEAAAKAVGVKLERDPATGEVLGIESQSFQQFAEKQYSFVFDNATDFLSGTRTSEAFLSKPPADSIKGDVIGRIRSVLGDIDGGLEGGNVKTAVKDLVTAMKNHGTGTTEGDDVAAVREAIETLHSFSQRLAEMPNVPKKTRAALDNVNAAVQKYEMGATKAKDLVASYYAGYNKLREVKSILGTNRGAHSPEVFENLVRGLDQLARTTGDAEGHLVQPLIRTAHLDSVLMGEANQPFRDMLTTQARSNLDALSFVKGYVTEGREVIGSGNKQAKRVGAALTGGVLRKMTGGSFIEGAAEGLLTGELLPNKASIVAKVALGGAKKAKNAAATVLKKGAGAVGAVDEAVSSKVSKQGYGSMLGEEAYLDDLKKKGRKK